MVFYRNLPLVKALTAVLEAIYGLQAKLQIRFAFFCLKEVASFLESQKFAEKLNLADLFIESECMRHLIDVLWSFMTLPHGYLTMELTYWVKRIVLRIYGPNLPAFLTKPTRVCVTPKYDYLWNQTEQKLAQEEQLKAI